MKHRIAWTVSLLGFVIVSLVACGPNKEMGRIQGKVFRSDTNQPIPNANVLLTVNGTGLFGYGGARYSTTTDDQGQYSLIVPVGNYNGDAFGASALYASLAASPCPSPQPINMSSTGLVMVFNGKNGDYQFVETHDVYTVEKNQVINENFDFHCNK